MFHFVAVPAERAQTLPRGSASLCDTDAATWLCKPTGQCKPTGHRRCHSGLQVWRNWRVITIGPIAIAAAHLRAAAQPRSNGSRSHAFGPIRSNASMRCRRCRVHTPLRTHAYTRRCLHTLPWAIYGRTQSWIGRSYLKKLMSQATDVLSNICLKQLMS